MVVGEKLQHGQVLYKDIWVSLAPLAAYCYSFIDWVFGRSSLAYQIIALILVTVQAGLFNNIMYRNKAYNENTYVPAFFYAICCTLFPDFITLSPILLGLTFVLLALQNVYLRIEAKLNDYTILLTGIFLGLATLFYLPAVIFLLTTIISFSLFTGTILRRYFLLLYGYFVPFLLIALNFYWKDALGAMWHHWMVAALTEPSFHHVDLLTFAIAFGVPVLFFLLGMVRTFNETRFTNFQVRVQQVMLIMFLLGIVGWLMTTDKMPYQWLIFVPPFAFFLSHYFLLLKKNWRMHVLFYLFLGAVLWVFYASSFHKSVLSRYMHDHNTYVQQSVFDHWTDGKKVWVLGEGTYIYKKAECVTPFLSWYLSKPLLEAPDQYDHVVYVAQTLQEDMPQVIIDKAGYLPAWQKRIPFLASRYEKLNQQVYVLKEN